MTLAELRQDVAETMHPFDALLLSCAGSASEWQDLRHMRISEAASWCAAERVTPS